MVIPCLFRVPLSGDKCGKDATVMVAGMALCPFHVEEHRARLLAVGHPPHASRAEPLVTGVYDLTLYHRTGLAWSRTSHRGSLENLYALLKKSMPVRSLQAKAEIRRHS